MALDTLRANRVRSSLTILGIVIGIASVISISSVINGINIRVARWVDSLGTNTFWVTRLPVIGVRPTAEMLGRKKFTLEDGEALGALPHVIAVDTDATYRKGFFVGQISARYNGKKVSGTILEGDTPEVGDVIDMPLREGRLFTQNEEMRSAHVCVLGHDIWEELFDGQPAVDKQINVETGFYTVIGVLNKRIQPFGSGKNPDDNMIYFPLRTFHNLHPEEDDLQILVKYDNAKNKALVEEEIREALRVRRKVRVQQADDFEIFSTESLSRLWDQLTHGLVLFMISVSSVGLMVGGVGVMNIMLVSVTERTREIGIRKAIGATRHAVLMQFTTEAIALCAVGGVLGVALGAVVTWIVYLLPIGLPATLSTFWVVTGLAASCAIGLVFGIYPAWKAANLDPIEALRYE